MITSVLFVANLDAVFHLLLPLLLLLLLLLHLFRDVVRLLGVDLQLFLAPEDASAVFAGDGRRVEDLHVSRQRRRIAESRRTMRTNQFGGRSLRQGDFRRSYRRRRERRRRSSSVASIRRRGDRHRRRRRSRNRRSAFHRLFQFRFDEVVGDSSVGFEKMRFEGVDRRKARAAQRAVVLTRFRLRSTTAVEGRRLWRGRNGRNKRNVYTTSYM